MNSREESTDTDIVIVIVEDRKPTITKYQGRRRQMDKKMVHFMMEPDG